MRYEDVALNASTQGIKVAKSLYTQDINPTQLKMTYNTKISFTVLTAMEEQMAITSMIIIL